MLKWEELDVLATKSTTKWEEVEKAPVTQSLSCADAFLMQLEQIFERSLEHWDEDPNRKKLLALLASRAEFCLVGLATAGPAATSPSEYKLLVAYLRHELFSRFVGKELTQSQVQMLTQEQAYLLRLEKKKRKIAGGSDIDSSLKERGGIGSSVVEAAMQKFQGMRSRDAVSKFFGVATVAEKRVQAGLLALDQIGIYRMMIGGGLLRQTLQYKTGEKFGPAKQSPIFSLAIPYWSADDPKEQSAEARASFLSSHEVLAKTSLMYLLVLTRDRTDHHPTEIFYLLHIFRIP